MTIKLTGNPEINTALAENIRLQMAQGIIDEQRKQISRLRESNQRLLERLWEANKDNLEKVMPSDPVKAWEAKHKFLKFFIVPVYDDEI